MSPASPFTSFPTKTESLMSLGLEYFQVGVQLFELRKKEGKVVGWLGGLVVSGQNLFEASFIRI